MFLTVIIATRIWFLKKCNTLSSTASWTLYFTVITQIVLDSGAIYCGAMITLVVSLALDSWFQCILVDSVSANYFPGSHIFFILFFFRWYPSLSVLEFSV